MKKLSIWISLFVVLAIASLALAQVTKPKPYTEKDGSLCI
jgi:hypothetical protein